MEAGMGPDVGTFHTVREGITCIRGETFSPAIKNPLIWIESIWHEDRWTRLIISTQSTHGTPLSLVNIICLSDGVMSGFNIFLTVPLEFRDIDRRYGNTNIFVKTGLVTLELNFASRFTSWGQNPRTRNTEVFETFISIRSVSWAHGNVVLMCAVKSGFTVLSMSVNCRIPLITIEDHQMEPVVGQEVLDTIRSVQDQVPGVVADMLPRGPTLLPSVCGTRASEISLLPLGDNSWPKRRG
ncbi:hypothetical protein BDZ94DRAFT_114648 [Collybia nuda]|uniref:Uncharacterized protein n=1 Tax=Collybia nuda TaxID=64659 RepID=A0A9P5XVD7_9AGAR|nr:hypothetical protein BDZ94DRAFT_114648 [Collybia nuda]